MMTERVFFFNDTATTEIYTLSLHDALPIWGEPWLTGRRRCRRRTSSRSSSRWCRTSWITGGSASRRRPRSEEHTSELQSRQYLVCRLLLEKKKTHLYLVLFTYLHFYRLCSL